MDFRRSGQLDERRRRVLRDELAQPTDSQSADAANLGSGSAKGPVRAYGPAVLAECQPRVTDLVPIRPLWMTVAILLALTAVAGIECLHIHARTLPLAGAAQFAALDVKERGSVAGWFSSLLLATGAGFAVIAFAIRRHRVDDYRGRYRVWLWTTAALALASLDAGTQIHEAIGWGIMYLAGQAVDTPSLAAGIAISWLALYGLVLGTLGIRLAIEVWNSLPAVAALSLAGLLYLASALATLGMLPQSGPLVASVVHTTIALLAHVSLVSAVALYARHVALDATGRLKVHIDPDRKRQAKKSRTRLRVVKEDKSDEPGSAPQPAAAKVAAKEPVKFTASPPTGPLTAKTAAAIARSAASSSFEDDEEEDEGEDGSERLSRAERRRLKKLARRDGQRRAA